jgi:hypothetical protein
MVPFSRRFPNRDPGGWARTVGHIQPRESRLLLDQDVRVGARLGSRNAGALFPARSHMRRLEGRRLTIAPLPSPTPNHQRASPGARHRTSRHRRHRSRSSKALVCGSIVQACGELTARKAAIRRLDEGERTATTRGQRARRCRGGLVRPTRARGEARHCTCGCSHEARR